jgi:hypothetical protein
MRDDTIICPIFYMSTISLLYHSKFTFEEIFVFNDLLIDTIQLKSNMVHERQISKTLKLSANISAVKDDITCFSAERCVLDNILQVHQPKSENQ